MSATTTRSIIRCAGLLARRGRGAIEVRSRRCRSRTAATARAGIADGRYGNRDNPVTPGPPPRAAGIALVADVETVPTPL